MPKKTALFLSLALIAMTSWSQPSPSQKSGKAGEAEFDQFEGEYGKKNAKPVRDPLRGYNRAMFWINDKFYFLIGKPLTQLYGLVLPKPVRVAVARAYVNLHFPVRFVNSALQGKFSGAGRELGRFVVNSSVGIGGLFDPAYAWLKWRPQDEDFGQTMGYYGVGVGFPVVLPLLGQSNLRDGLGMTPNFLLNPVYYVTSHENFLAVAAGDKFNYLSLHGEEYEKIKKDALDPYTFIRDAHLQNREAKIKE